MTSLRWLTKYETKDEKPDDLNEAKYRKALFSPALLFAGFKTQYYAKYD